MNVFLFFFCFVFVVVVVFCDNLHSYPVPGHSWPIGEGGGGYTPIAPLAL